MDPFIPKIDPAVRICVKVKLSSDLRPEQIVSGQRGKIFTLTESATFES